MINVLIIEDEPLTATRLEKMLTALDPGIQVLGHLPSVRQTVAWLRNQPKPDLLFMDIHLSDGMSFEIFSQVQVDIPVIFTTAYDQYALEAFQVHGIGYLLKPVEKEKLKSCVERYRQYNYSTQPVQLLKALEKIELQATVHRKRFLVNYRDQLLAVTVQDIAYFSSEFKVTYIITHDNKKYSIDSTLEELEAELNPFEFMRITRQLIVSPQSIIKIHQHFNGRLKLELLPSSKEEVIISRDRSVQFKNWLGR